MKASVEAVHEDYMLNLPDECLSMVFSSLSTQSDRNTCSLVCHRWYRVEAQSRQRLVLHAVSTLEAFLPVLLTRFGNVTKLALKTDDRTESITDDSLSFISTKLPRLIHLKLQSCKTIMHEGISTLATSRWLRKISFSSCDFGPRHLITVLTSCSMLQDLSLKRLKRYNPAIETLVEVFKDPSQETLSMKYFRLTLKHSLRHKTFTGSDSLKSVCLKDLHNLLWIAPYLARCKNLRMIKILRFSGSLSGPLNEITSMIPDITVHLEQSP